MSSETLRLIEENIIRSKAMAEVGAALERLRANKDFKKVILEGYFRDEAVRLVHLKSDPNMQAPDRQQSIVAQMDAIGALNQYFVTIGQLAAVAEKSIASDEEMREEMLREELTNG